ncbi:hypothetical protein M0802_008314 [Mischocyttarus mexicanus]|nr:hypothetical protein M0802_008314 [Mischocyttarus mexicanus]
MYDQRSRISREIKLDHVIVAIFDEVPQVSVWPEREREDVVAVADGGGGGGGGGAVYLLASVLPLVSYSYSYQEQQSAGVATLSMLFHLISGHKPAPKPYAAEREKNFKSWKVLLCFSLTESFDGFSLKYTWVKMKENEKEENKHSTIRLLRRTLDPGNEPDSILHIAVTAALYMFIAKKVKEEEEEEEKV